MKQNNETFSLSAQMAIINITLGNPNLSLIELMTIQNSLEFFILKNPKDKSRLEAKLVQVETRITKAKNAYPPRETKLAERVLKLVNFDSET